MFEYIVVSVKKWHIYCQRAVAILRKKTSMIVLRCKVCSGAIGDQGILESRVFSAHSPMHLVMSYIAFLLFPEKNELDRSKLDPYSE